MGRRPGLLIALVALVAATACAPAGRGAEASDAAAGTPVSPAFTLTSPAVSDGRLLPAYRCEPKANGVEESIPLAWSGVPAGTGSLAVVMHHYPVPGDTSRVSSYLLLWDIPPSVSEIPHGGADDGPWFMGPNKDGAAISYTSPCSRGSGEHEYTITLYALDETPAALPRHSSLDVSYEVLGKAIASAKVLGTATLTFVATTP